MAYGGGPGSAIMLSEQPEGCGAIVPRAHEPHTERDDDIKAGPSQHRIIFMWEKKDVLWGWKQRLGDSCFRLFYDFPMAPTETAQSQCLNRCCLLRSHFNEGCTRTLREVTVSGTQTSFTADLNLSVKEEERFSAFSERKHGLKVTMLDFQTSAFSFVVEISRSVS